jgi:predicted  nucleic acid-binding Zn-ribbon protein
MATSKKTTPTPKKAAKPPVVVVKKEKFNAENEIKVVLERLKAIDDYITRSDNADTKDKQKFEKFMETANGRISRNADGLKDFNTEITAFSSEIRAMEKNLEKRLSNFISAESIIVDGCVKNVNSFKERVESLEKSQEANENRIINLSADWGKQKNQNETSFRALSENQTGNEMAIEAVDEAMRKTFSIYSGIAIIGFIAGIGAIAMEIYKCYH